MVKKEKNTEIRVRCDDELKARLIEIARKEERTLSGQVLYFLKKAMHDYPLGD